MYMYKYSTCIDKWGFDKATGVARCIAGVTKYCFSFSLLASIDSTRLFCFCMYRQLQTGLEITRETTLNSHNTPINNLLVTSPTQEKKSSLRKLRFLGQLSSHS